MVATEHKSMKYSNLPTHYFFQPIAVEILERLVYCLQTVFVVSVYGYIGNLSYQEVIVRQLQEFLEHRCIT